MGKSSDIVKVGLGSRSYDILLGAGNLSALHDELTSIDFSEKIAVISNPDIASLYADKVCGNLAEVGRDVRLITVPEGEEYKNLATLNLIYDELIGQGFDRSCGLIALGGGVIGDTVGFAAATFLRGVPFVQIPTTLLAQVDSSVGGKTAVNHPLGKNLIGAFYQPRLVLIDIETLSTLDPREMVSGLAEVVKYGVIKDPDFFLWLEEHAEELLSLDRDCLIHAIRTSCQIKSDIVEIDETENSIRALLNYGHTFGHAIESLAGYGQWRHGEAVAVGMVIAARISAALGFCSEPDVERIVHLLERFNLPTQPPPYSLADYVESMKRDKKVSGGTLMMVLNTGIGSARLEKISDIEAEFIPFVEKGRPR
ncbi:MAG: 3-dehydroquinate synthase [Desulfuromonadales bacterium]|nr:3-dehydroquinate synthase [Desulfuromonadales bacterium]